MGIEEKAAYVKGLLDGLELDPNAKETKIFRAISDFIQCSASKYSNLKEDFEDLEEKIDDIEKIIEELDDEKCDCDDPDDDCGCNNSYSDDECEDDSCDRKHCSCPSCGEEISKSNCKGKSRTVCPKCKTYIRLRFDDECCSGSDDCSDSEDDSEYD